MSAAVLRIQNALMEAAPEWDWSFSPLQHRGEDKFKVVAKLRHSRDERTVYVSEKQIFNMSPKDIVREIVRFLPANKLGLTMTEEKTINVGKHYSDLRASYGRELDRLRQMAARIPIGSN